MPKQRSFRWSRWALLCAAMVGCPALAAAEPADQMLLDRDMELAIDAYQFFEYDEASSLFQSILDRDATTAKAHLYLGVIQAQKRQFDLAIPHLAFAHEQMPNNEMAAFWYATALQATGQIPQANMVLQQFLASFPENGEVRFRLALGLVLENRYEEAATHLEGLADHETGAMYDSAVRQLIPVLIKLRDLDKARARLAEWRSRGAKEEEVASYDLALKEADQVATFVVSIAPFYQDNPTLESSNSALAQAKQPDWGLDAGIGMRTASFNLFSISQTQLSYNFAATQYQKVTGYNMQTHALVWSNKLLDSQEMWTTDIVYTRTNLASAHFLDTAAIQIGKELRGEDGTGHRWNLNAFQEMYTTANTLDATRIGSEMAWTTGAGRALLGYNLGLRYYHTSADYEQHGYVSAGINYNRSTGPIQWTALFDLQYIPYLKNDPSYGIKRRDTVEEAVVSIDWSLSTAQTLGVRYEGSFHQSNIDLRAYKSQRYLLTWNGLW